MISHLRNRYNLFYSMTKHLSSDLPKFHSTATAATSRVSAGKELWAIEKVFDKEGSSKEECLFPVFANLNLTTDGKEHNFKVPCDQVIKYVMMGAINKNIALQYCHYLANLIRNGDKEYTDYYRQRVLNLTSYLRKNSEGLVKTKLCSLLCDVASSDVSSCLIICGGLEGEDINTHQYSSLLDSCHKFGLWKQASFLLRKYSADIKFYTRTFDSAAEGIIKSASNYKDPNLDAKAKAQLKADLFEYLVNLMEICRKDRQYLITKNKNAFVKSLQDFGVQVVVHPQIEQSGRCSSCETSLPLNDDSDTQRVNEIVWGVLKTKIPGMGSHLFAAENELMEFQDFCNRLNQIDNIPIDCVIDGLNLSYRITRTTVKYSRQVSDNVVQSMVGHDFDAQVKYMIDSIVKTGLLRNYKKILIICRRHIRNLPGLFDFFNRNKIHCFLTDDKSNDDLFQLYAATLNPSCFLVTNDYLRDHLSLMPPEARRDVGRWIETHQIYIQPRSLSLLMPTKFEKLPAIDRKQGLLHLPIIDYHALRNSRPPVPPLHLNSAVQTWLCCKLNPSE